MLSAVEGFIVPLLAIMVAELGDKTQFSIILLSSKTSKYGVLLIGVFFAFLIVDGLAVLVGGWISKVVPMMWLKIVSGLVFILFGLYMFLNQKQEEKKGFGSKNVLWSSFLLVFMAEWGDKTQIAAGLFATRYNLVLVLIGCMLALMFLSLLAVFMGKLLFRYMDRNLLDKVAGVVFMVLGLLFLLL